MSRQTVNNSQASLVKEPSILNRFAQELTKLGVVSEDRSAKLTYLALTSRFLERPLCVVVKGPSSAGKSFLVNQVLKFFPPEAYYELSAMSPKALIYSEEPLQHRVVIIAEATGIQNDFTDYLIRTLISEGYFKYESVEPSTNGHKPVSKKKDGPTGFIVTTTAINLHRENETRMFSIPMNDTPEQTKRIMQAKAREASGRVKPRNSFDATEWHKLQKLLAAAEHSVVIPYAEEPANSIPAVAVRLRRDFSALLRLIASHAILHQFQRSKDCEGNIIATLDDYAVVRELVEDILAVGSGAKVSETVRETVEVVQRLLSVGGQVTVSRLAKALRLDDSAALRRAQQAIKSGYLVNEETRPRLPARLMLSPKALGQDRDLLPRSAGLQGSANGPYNPYQIDSKGDYPSSAGLQAEECLDPPHPNPFNWEDLLQTLIW